ncbi:MAG: flagellar FliJ family protein [Demequina sp.]
MTRRFPLAALLRARQLQEDQAAAALARANRDKAQAELAVRTALQDHAALTFRANRHEGPGPGTERAWQAVVVARAASSARFQDLALAVDLARSSAEDATAVWTDARRQAEAIGRLGERHAASLAEDDLKEEQRGLDEAALRQAKEKS